MDTNTTSNTDNSKLDYYIGTNFNGNLDIELSQGNYSDETEIISPYIESVFKSINSTLEGFNSLVTSANSYFLENEEIEKINLPEFTELNFQVNTMKKLTSNSLFIGTDNKTANIQVGTVVEVIEPDDNGWTKVSFHDEDGNLKVGYITTESITKDEI